MADILAPLPTGPETLRSSSVSLSCLVWSITGCDGGALTGASQAGEEGVRRSTSHNTRGVDTASEDSGSIRGTSRG